jgi:hypothetical protein
MSLGHTLCYIAGLSYEIFILDKSRNSHCLYLTLNAHSCERFWAWKVWTKSFLKIENKIEFKKEFQKICNEI